MLAIRTSGKDCLHSQGFLAIFGAMVNPAERLIEGFGGRGPVADRFGISREAVRLWLLNGIPADKALDVEEATKRTKFPISAIEVLRYARQLRKAA